MSPDEFIEIVNYQFASDSDLHAHCPAGSSLSAIILADLDKICPELMQQELAELLDYSLKIPRVRVISKVCGRIQCKRDGSISYAMLSLRIHE